MGSYKWKIPGRGHQRGGILPHGGETEAGERLKGMDSMDFQVGDKVVHWAYGPGEIVNLEEKVLSGQTNLYYVVQVNDLTLWVPSDEKGKRSMRLPTPAASL
jgi:hypothetical protein